MLRPKKRIPSLVVAALALTGCGEDATLGSAGTGGTAGTGGSPGSGGADSGPVQDGLKAFCMRVGECFPNADYEAGCVDSLSYFELLSQYFNDECNMILGGYFYCLAESSCADIEDYSAYAACADEIDRGVFESCSEMLPQP